VVTETTLWQQNAVLLLMGCFQQQCHCI